MKKINVIIFSLMIVACFIMYLSRGEFGKMPSKSEIEILYNENEVYRNEMISIYGLTQKLLGKKAIEDFSLFKTECGNIVRIQKEKSLEEIEDSVLEIGVVFQYLEEEEVPYFYITNILPISDEMELPIGVEDYSVQNAEHLLTYLEGNRVPVINLREKEAIAMIAKEQLFYKTDHHWTIESCFAAYSEIINELELAMGWTLNERDIFTDKEHYTAQTFPDSFLGSYGIKMGQYYVNRDDFTILIPNFEMDFSFEAYDSKGNLILSKDGDYTTAFLDKTILENESYNNKYNSFCNNCSVENRMINNTTENEKKVLLIAHSYGRPLAQYLSICFKEVRFIDPQEGRFSGDYRTYIEEYQPDVVLFFVENEGQIIGNYNISSDEK